MMESCTVLHLSDDFGQELVALATSPMTFPPRSATVRSTNTTLWLTQQRLWQHSRRLHWSHLSRTGTGVQTLHCRKSVTKNRLALIPVSTPYSSVVHRRRHGEGIEKGRGFPDLYIFIISHWCCLVGKNGLLDNPSRYSGHSYSHAGRDFTDSHPTFVTSQTHDVVSSFEVWEFSDRREFLQICLW